MNEKLRIYFRVIQWTVFLFVSVALVFWGSQLWGVRMQLAEIQKGSIEACSLWNCTVDDLGKIHCIESRVDPMGRYMENYTMPVVSNVSGTPRG